MKQGREESFAFGEGQYCGEPVFVPKPGSVFDPEAASQGGWLLSEVYDGHRQRSFLALFDAERIPEGPLAHIDLEHHVPFSYHGWWADP